MFVIKARKLTKRFGKFTAVNGIDLEIREGEIFGLLGPNGAGKTTTLSMLSTLLPLTSGTATVNNYEVSKDPSNVRKSIGFVFQDPSSDDTLTGRENLYLHGLMYGVDRKEINNKMDEVLDLVDLKDKQHELVKHYSGGMRRRLELARGLLHEPKALFLDEPTLGLDPHTREHIWAYIKKLVKEKKVTIILTTHYMEEADSICDRVAIIDHGKIKIIGTPEELKRKMGGELIRIKIRNPNTAKLKRLRYVRRAEQKGGFLTITVDNAGARVQDILRVAGKVDYVESRSPTLNDVFLRYTGRGLKDESESEGGWFQRSMSYESRKND